MKISPEVAEAVDKYIDRDGKASERIEEPKLKCMDLDLKSMYPSYYELERIIESVMMRCMERMLREFRYGDGYSSPSHYSTDEYYRRELERSMYAVPSKPSK